MSLVLLGLITLFLFKEGIEFFSQYEGELTVSRRSGMEYANIVTKQYREQTALYWYLEKILSEETAYFDSLSQDDHRKEQARKAKDKFLAFTRSFQDTKELLLHYEKDIVDLANETRLFIATREVVLDLRREAIALDLPKEDFSQSIDQLEKRISFSSQELERWQNYFIRHNRDDLAKRIDPRWSDKTENTKEGEIRNHVLKIEGSLDKEYTLIIENQRRDFTKLFENFEDAFCLENSKASFAKARIATNEYFAKVPQYHDLLSQWDPTEPHPRHKAFTNFILGTEWVTTSPRQNWYGVLPLLSGSLLVTFIALFIAIPMGVGSAVYVNQVASRWEKAIIKPGLEFIAVIPSVVIGFFGIKILAPIIYLFTDERLNSLTAGCLLAFMAIPTIFTLSEDALNNVSKSFREASLSLGATRWQTCTAIIFPSAFPGIVSAVLLGLGRVIGETMVVLLCAGNKSTIPDFTSGLGVFAQPVHTMTGIIAQEMGEVEGDSIHYRALFMVGVVLFLLSLSINYLSQSAMRKHKLSYS